MQREEFLFQALVYLAAAVVSVPIAKRLGLGSVLGYLVAGVVIGPFGLQLIGEEGQDVMHFAEFGVVMMLFVIGLELRPGLLWRLRGPILGMGGLQVAITSAAIAGIALWAGLPWKAAVAVGMILSLSSTAIVLQTLSEKGLGRTDSGQSSFAVLLFQDVAVIPMLAILPLLAVVGAEQATTGAHAHGFSWVADLPGWAQTLAVLGVMTGIVVAGRLAMTPAFRLIARTRLREIFTAAALLLVIATALLMRSVGLSPALGTFLAGVVLANSEYRHELEADIEPFKGLLLGLFFIAVGASIDFGLIGDQPRTIGAIVVGLLLVKFVVLFVLGRVFKMGLDQNVLFAFSLAQGGEFAFVLFSFATQNGVLSTGVAGPLTVAVALSMAATPLLMLINEKLVQPRFGTREKAEQEPDVVDEDAPIIIAGYGRFGNIVGRLLSANGVKATVLDIDSDHVDVLRKFGQKVFYGDASRRDLLVAAGAGKAKVLVLAIDDQEKALQLVNNVRRWFPHLTILARASNREYAYELLDAGVEHVYRETLDTSLRAGTDALRLVGLRAHCAHRSAKTFRRHDEEHLRELARLRHDRKGYIRHARQRIQDLEETLRTEQAEFAETKDEAWDATSRREAFLAKNAPADAD
jgi:monovalent cation:proton antiporter-2 (CPA2) family protein